MERFATLQGEATRTSSLYRALGAFEAAAAGRVPRSLEVAVPAVRWARAAERHAPLQAGLLFGTPFGLVYLIVLSWAGGFGVMAAAMALIMALGTGLAFGWIVQRAFRHVVIPFHPNEARAVESAIRAGGWTGTGVVLPQGGEDAAPSPGSPQGALPPACVFRKPRRAGRLYFQPDAGGVGFLAGPMGPIGEVVLGWRPDLAPDASPNPRAAPPSAS